MTVPFLKAAHCLQKEDCRASRELAEPPAQASWIPASEAPLPGPQPGVLIAPLPGMPFSDYAANSYTHPSKPQFVTSSEKASLVSYLDADCLLLSYFLYLLSLPGTRCSDPSI